MPVLASSPAYRAKVQYPGTQDTRTNINFPRSRYFSLFTHRFVPAVPVPYLRYQYPDSVLKVPDPTKEARWVGAADALGGGGAGGGPRYLSSNMGWFRGCLDAKDGLCTRLHMGNAANATYMASKLQRFFCNG